MKRYCLALDLKDDPALIEQYEAHHRQVWPEVRQSILDAGISELEIYRVRNRLFMILETSDSFSLEEKAQKDLENPMVVEWETLMWTFQKPLPWAAEGEKWQLMDKICEISDEQ